MSRSRFKIDTITPSLNQLDHSFDLSDGDEDVGLELEIRESKNSGDAQVQEAKRDLKEIGFSSEKNDPENPNSEILPETLQKTPQKTPQKLAETHAKTPIQTPIHSPNQNLIKTTIFKTLSPHHPIFTHELSNTLQSNSSSLKSPTDLNQKTVQFAESPLNSPTMQNTNPGDKTYLKNTLEAVPTVSNYRETETETPMPKTPKQRPTMEQLHERFIDPEISTQNQDFESRPNSQTNLIRSEFGSSKRGRSGLGFDNLGTQSTHTIQDVECDLGRRVNSEENGLVLTVDIEKANEGAKNSKFEGRSSERQKISPKTPESQIDPMKTKNQAKNQDSKPVPEIEKKLQKMDVEIQKPKQPIKFGWFEGVFFRCLLNIWGVMLFLRMSWIVGHAGVLFTLLIIGLATCVTLITTTSMSAICTNGQVKGGGAYYLISRSLGPEFGGAIGLIFSLANCVAVAMYVAGFVETVVDLYDDYFTGSVENDMRVIGVVTVIILLAITQAGMAWESKMQIGLLIILVISIINWIVGSFIVSNKIIDQGQGFFSYKSELMIENLGPGFAGDESFFSIFSIFFPAATGILAGSNISGDLKDAQTAIPKGTFLAIFVTSAVYGVVAFTLGGTGMRIAGENLVGNDTMSVYQSYMQPCPSTKLSNYSLDSAACRLNVTYPEQCQNYYTTDYTKPECLGLLNDMQFMAKFSGWKPIITAGIFAATLSSALTSLVSAPKVFQALCKDEVFPYIKWFAKGYGPNEDPRRAYGLAFVLSVGFILAGDLNTIAPVISNFFLASYCLINYSCFAASLSKTPGWRPSYKYYSMWLSLLGAGICGIIMFVINWIAGLVTISLISVIYKYIDYRAKSGLMNINWGSSQQGYAYTSALGSTLKLRAVVYHVKNFRPGILVLSGSPTERPALTYLAANITKNVALMINAEICTNELKTKELEAQRITGEKWLESKNINSFVQVVNSKTVLQGVSSLMQVTGLGQLKPNTLFLGYKSDWLSCGIEDVKNYTAVIHQAFRLRFGVGILRIGDQGLKVDHGYDEKHDEAEGTENSPEKSPKTTSNLKRKSLVPNQINDALKFFSPEGKTGKRKIDVWWLFDDGGLVILVAHLLKQHKPFKNAEIRVFTGGKESRLNEEERKLIQLLQKFRIEVTEVKVLPELNKSPKESDREAMRKKIAKYRLKDNDDEEILNKNTEGKITDHEWDTLREKTLRQVKINELIRKYSSKSDLTVVSCPIGREGISPWLYMLWLDELSKDLKQPILMLRGNQENAITFYS